MAHSFTNLEAAVFARDELRRRQPLYRAARDGTDDEFVACVLACDARMERSGVSLAFLQRGYRAMPDVQIPAWVVMLDTCTLAN